MAAFWRASLFAVVCVVIDNGAYYLEQVQRVRMIAACTRNLRIRYFAAYFRQDSFLTVNLPKLFQNGADLAEQNFLDSSSRHIAKVQRTFTIT